MSSAPTLNRLHARAPAPARRRLLGAAAGMGLLGTLGACSAPLPPLRVGSIVFPGYELMFLARDLGLLDEKQVRLVEMDSSTDAMRALAVGRLEAAALTLDELMSQRADGVDLRMLMVFDVSDGADVVISRRPLKALRELAGQRIGVEDGATGALMLGALLDAAGLRAAEVHKVPVTLNGSADAFRKSRLDAVVTSEPWATQLEAEGAQRVFDSRALPDRIVDVLAVRSDMIERHAAALAQLVRGSFDAMRKLQQQPGEAARLLAPRLELGADAVLPAFRGLKLPDAAEQQRMLARGAAFERSVQQLQKQMLDQGLLRQPIALRELFDTRFLPH